MEEKKIVIEKEKFTQLRTMIPQEVYEELTEFAKVRETFTGAWDYGNAIKELLWAYKVFYNLNTRIDKLEQQIDMVSNIVPNKEVEEVKTDKEEDYHQLLGGKKIRK